MRPLNSIKRPVFSTLLILAGFISGPSFGAEITGAGSTFVYPIIAKWADTYKSETGSSINYQSIGSGGGIKQIETKPEPTVDFGATDKPLTPEELEKENLIQFPIINGAIVPVVNLEGVKDGTLKLSGTVLADIYLGKITKWNDPVLVAMNKGIKLPAQDITVVHRSDGSGTTFIFTNYLSKVSSTWKEKVKEGTAVDWPVGVGGKGNEGVAANVKQIKGSIGYVEFAYAVQSKMNYTQMENHEHQFVKPSDESFAAAANGVDWTKAPGFFLIMTDAAGKKSWPIAGSTFILMQKTQTKAAQGTEALKFFKWAYAHGEAAARELHYVPIPKKVSEVIEKKWREEIKGVEFNKSL